MSAEDYSAWVGRTETITEEISSWRTGALAATAALSGRVDLRGQRVGVIVSGGNVDLAAVPTLLALANAPA